MAAFRQDKPAVMERQEKSAQKDKHISRLSPHQMERLESVLNEVVDIHGTGNFPTISVRLIHLISCVRRHLRKEEMLPKSVKLNGGAATFVASSRDFVYSDLDLIFAVSFEKPDAFHKVRVALYKTLLELMPSSTNKSRISVDTLKDTYLRKMVKVESDDRWSLFSLHNDFGRCIELKFVDRMRRQFEFSVDSFQILLDPLLDSPPRPSTTIESVFGDLALAIKHLDSRVIATYQPEEIRGGGLLKYCHLLMRGFKPDESSSCMHLEKYMCSRFFIDFPDLSTQEAKLRSYVDNHFGSFDSWSCNEDSSSDASTSQTPSALAVSQAKYDFLMLLHRVISESTVCLMLHERRCTLQLIDRLAFSLSMEPLQISLPACQGPRLLPSPGGFSSSSSSSSASSYSQLGRPMLLYLPANQSQWIPVV